MNSPKLNKLAEDLQDFTDVAGKIEGLMKPLRRRRLTTRKEQI